MEILSLINELQELVSEGRTLWGSSVMVDKGRALDILSKMRINVPSAIKDGERMIQEKDRIIAEARSHAESLTLEASEQAKHIVSQEAVALQAQAEAEEILVQAQEETARMRRDAEQYQLNVLRELSETLHKILNEVERGLTVLESRTGSQDDEMY